MAGAATAFVPYGGRTLASSSRVFWKVRAWDGRHRPGPWSEPATWTMGLLAPGDWRAAWISGPGETESLLLRGRFQVRGPVRRAVCFASGLGQYDLYLNGGRVGDNVLRPGWTNYDRTVLFNTYDVTAQLRAGANTAGFLVGNGFYDVVRRNRFTKLTTFYGPLRAIFQLRIEYADGTVQTVASGPDWDARPGPITTGNIYAGEDEDARKLPPDWAADGGGGKGWSAAVVCRLPDGLRLTCRDSGDPILIGATQLPVGRRTFPDGSAVYDLGQEASYLIALTVSGPRGSVVRATPAEVVNPNGTINRNTMDGKNRGNAWVQYTKATDGPETWQPHFYYIGCRYLEVRRFASAHDLPRTVPAEDSAHPAVIGPALTPAEEARLPRVDTIAGRLVQADAPAVGDFAASDPLLNRIRDLVRWAQRSNLMSVLTDCPHREKLGWLEQYHLNGPALRYEFDASRIFAKTMRDIADEQEPDGAVPNIAPEYVRFEGPFRHAAEWGAAYILVPWQQYEFDGDTRLMGAHYAGMKRYFEHLRGLTVDGVLRQGLGDWFDQGPRPPGPAQNTPPAFTATAFLYEDASTLAREAAVLGRRDDQARFAAAADEIRRDFNRHFFDSAAQAYRPNSQAADAIALAFGLVDPEAKAAVLRALIADLERRGYAVTTGDIGFRFLLQALAENGRSDVVYRLATQRDHPGYAWQLAHGATTLTEAWDADLNTSHDHFMLGQITEWLYRELAGIDIAPDGAGFSHLWIHPAAVPGLAWVAATYRTIHGPVSVRWTHAQGRFRLTLTLPPNVTATVQLPGGRTVPGVGSGQSVFTVAD